MTFIVIIINLSSYKWGFLGCVPDPISYHMVGGMSICTC